MSQPAPPDDVLGEKVVSIRDVWAVDDRVYCAVETVSRYVATCLLVDTDTWIVCHYVKERRAA